jgi:hypothetical protein
VLVLLFLVWKRFIVVGTSVATYGAIALYMTSRFGWRSWPLFLEKQKAVADFFLDSIQNQSLHGIVMHLFRPTCGPHSPVIQAATLVSTALALALISAACFVARRSGKTERDQQLLFAGFVPLAMFTSQWSWEHYNVILLLPFSILACELSALWRAGGSRLVVAVSATGLAVVLYAAFLPVETKVVLQQAVRAGDRSKHFSLHLHEALNSAPLVLLLLVASILVRTHLVRARAASEPARLPAVPHDDQAQPEGRLSPR